MKPGTAAGIALGLIVWAALMAWVVSIKMGIWIECHAENSWWYCWSLVSR